MITCVRCGRPLARSLFCSDLAILVLHWMSRHPIEWARMHPETARYNPYHPAYVKT